MPAMNSDSPAIPLRLVARSWPHLLGGATLITAREKQQSTGGYASIGRDPGDCRSLIITVLDKTAAQIKVNLSEIVAWPGRLG